MATIVHDRHIEMSPTTTGDRIAITSDNQCNIITWDCNSLQDSILGLHILQPLVQWTED